MRGGGEADGYSKVDVDGDVGCIGLGAVGLGGYSHHKGLLPTRPALSSAFHH